MNRRLDAYLCKTYPHVFADRGASMRTTAMCWGFECGNGWYSIIKAAAAKLEPLIVEWIKKDPENDEYHPRASQVKEKFGTLRFYLSSGTDEMYAITDKAERQSSKTCEVCGRPGKLRGRGWLYTACKRHVRAS